jgi:NAD dependent epimerase/dehydratase family enzyme
VRAIRFLIDHPDTSGAFNLTAPNPATNTEITAAMGELLHRPTFLTVPAVALRTALGEMSQEVLGSSRVIPRRLLECGFDFTDPTVEDALRAALAA